MFYYLYEPLFNFWCTFNGQLLIKHCTVYKTLLMSVYFSAETRNVYFCAAYGLVSDPFSQRILQYSFIYLYIIQIGNKVLTTVFFPV